MGCCQCKPEFRELYQLSPATNIQLTSAFTFKDADSFDDISIPSHDNSIIVSTIPNDPSYTNQNTARSPPETPRPRSTSYSPLGRKSDLETAFLFSGPIFTKQNLDNDGVKNEIPLPSREERLRIKLSYWKRRSFTGVFDKKQESLAINEIVNELEKKFSKENDEDGGYEEFQDKV
ncbi:unnamed protein product [Blepharisma stoltei]|uniref:Uncharacterized protein n=1 Tax=Blepharisma stoltei TaxID=1481888 RepID=A0AAU9J5F8_9CILI|nr:unnamed protein product [Blepharisma stoltei]